MLIVADNDVLTGIFVGDRREERFHTLVIVDQVGIVGFTIHNASSGVVIEINAVLTPIELVPDIVVAVRVVEKIPVRLGVR